MLKKMRKGFIGLVAALALVSTVGISSASASSENLDLVSVQARTTSGGYDSAIKGVSTKMYTVGYPVHTSIDGDTRTAIRLGNGIVGWKKDNGYINYYFKNNTTGVTTVNQYGPAQNSTHKYELKVEGTDIVGRVDGVEIGRTTYDGNHNTSFFSQVNDNLIARHAGSLSNATKFSEMRVLKNGYWNRPLKLVFDTQGWAGKYADYWTSGEDYFYTYDSRN